jgi:hypothetical protein
MKVNSLYILNKAGGLIYQNDVNTGLTKLTANDYLVLAGTLHSVHAIGSRLTSTINHGKTGANEVPSTQNSTNNQLLSSGKFLDSNSNRSGLQSIETDLFNLYIFQSLTGIKFIIITSSNPVVQQIDTPEKFKAGELNLQYELVQDIFKKLYSIYSDYVMKDPFYSIDMPIKSQLFETKVIELVSAT